MWCEVLEKGEQSLIEKEAGKKEKRPNLRRREIYSNDQSRSDGMKTA